MIQKYLVLNKLYVHKWEYNLLSLCELLFPDFTIEKADCADYASIALWHEQLCRDLIRYTFKKTFFIARTTYYENLERDDFVFALRRAIGKEAVEHSDSIEGSEFNNAQAIINACELIKDIKKCMDTLALDKWRNCMNAIYQVLDQYQLNWLYKRFRLTLETISVCKTQLKNIDILDISYSNSMMKIDFAKESLDQWHKSIVFTTLNECSVTDTRLMCSCIDKYKELFAIEKDYNDLIFNHSSNRNHAHHDMVRWKLYTLLNSLKSTRNKITLLL
jgi:hypothetical protein